MHRIRSLVLVCWIGLLGGLAMAQAPQPAPAAIAAEAFYRVPDLTGAKLSPSGRWLAVSTGYADRRIGLAVFDLKTLAPLAMAAKFDDADIDEFHWVNDERLAFSLKDNERGSGDQRFAPGLFSVARDGQGLTQLVKLRSEFVVDRPQVGRGALEPNHWLLHVPAGGGDEVIVGEIKWGRDGESPTLLPQRLNINTRRTVSLAQGAPGPARGWLFDARGQPRLAMTGERGRTAFHWRDTDDGPWRRIAEFEALAPPFWPRFVDSDGKLYVTVDEGAAGTSVLTTFDFAAGAPRPDPLVRTKGFDFTGAIVSETVGGKALGVRALTDAESTVWFDRGMAALQAEAEKRLPGRVVRLDCRRCDQPDRVVLAHAWSDTDPGQFWIHRAQDDHWAKLADVRSGIDPRRMAETDFQRIPARDGRELPVWTTRTRQAAVQALAAVVLVHGGPWVRGRSWRWDADAQFLASRGYLVIEPEFRGSDGYGEAHFRAGFRQWGRAMQDDVADAVLWAVRKGLADPTRVCIAGAGYGGYAALMGLVRHPELYRCGVAWAAITDPRLMFDWRPDHDLPDELSEHRYPQLIGDPEKDAAMLESVTPLAQAGRIKAPLFMAIGGKDWRVPRVHGTRMRDALERAGRAPEWVEYPDEGHGWRKLETRLDFARRLEDFLARHLR